MIQLWEGGKRKGRERQKQRGRDGREKKGGEGKIKLLYQLNRYNVSINSGAVITQRSSCHYEWLSHVFPPPTTSSLNIAVGDYARLSLVGDIYIQHTQQQSHLCHSDLHLSLSLWETWLSLPARAVMSWYLAMLTWFRRSSSLYSSLVTAVGWGKGRAGTCAHLNDDTYEIYVQDVTLILKQQHSREWQGFVAKLVSKKVRLSSHNYRSLQEWKSWQFKTHWMLSTKNKLVVQHKFQSSWCMGELCRCSLVCQRIQQIIYDWLLPPA